MEAAFLSAFAHTTSEFVDSDIDKVGSLALPPTRLPAGADSRIRRQIFVCRKSAGKIRISELYVEISTAIRLSGVLFERMTV